MTTATAHRTIKLLQPLASTTADAGRSVPMSHPDSNAPPDLTPIQIGEVWENPVTREQATILELAHLKRSGQTSVLRQAQSATIEPNEWHDWWNASDRDARVRVEVTPGERFGHMIETFFGLARLGHTDARGMPHVLQLALCAREFSDVMVFRSPPLPVQRLLLGALAPLAHWRGYRATYPQLSRTVLARKT